MVRTNTSIYVNFPALFPETALAHPSGADFHRPSGQPRPNLVLAT
jgi:hypothetical protein